MKKAICLQALMLALGTGLAAAQETAPAPALRFEVVSVKLDPSATPPDHANSTFSMSPSGLFSAENIPVRTLLQYAWNVPDDRIAKAPGWIDTNRYDITGKAPAGTPSPNWPSGPSATLRLMLQGLLVDRFKLVAHTETRLVKSYVLTPKGSPPKLIPSTGAGEPHCEIVPQPDVPGTHVGCTHMPMTELAALLPNMAPQYITKSVTDFTGLAGDWDFPLDWTGQASIDANGGVTIFGALEKLGLKLDSKTVPLAVYVIDRVEPASANAN